MRQKQAVFAFNRGLISALALGREDVKRVALGASIFVNFIARVLGSMAFRQGWQYLGNTLSNAAARSLPFIFGTTDTAIIELTDSAMRVWISDALLTRTAVSTTVTNGTFASNINNWTDGSDAGGAVAWDTGNYLKLTANGTARAIAYQVVTVAGGDVSKEHALRIVIDRGPVTLRVGSSLGDDSYVTETNLDAGTHSIAFTPTGNFYVQFSAVTIFKTRVTSCVVESAGVVSVPAPWIAADLGKVRFDQSGDIVYVACDGYQQRKIERRGARPGARSWSVCQYHADDGPFMIQNVGPTTITGSATTGDITLTASAPLFRSGHVGAIFTTTTSGQTQTASASAQNTFTAPIKVTGVGAASRTFNISITGTWTGTVTLQWSFGSATGPFTDVTGNSWTANTSYSPYDGIDNSVIYYRLGIKTGNYGSGTAVMTLTYASGIQRGIVRVTAVASSTSASAQVLAALGGTGAATIWSEGSWSSYRGFPTSVRIHEGRLWWFGKGGIFGSVSDAYASFDETVTGDSAPLNRTIGSGPVDVVNWGISTQRLLIGSQGAEISCRSSSLDEPITPVNFNMKTVSTQGSAAVEPVKVDQVAIFVQRGGIRVYQLALDPYKYEFAPTDLTALVPELGSPGIVRMAIQRQPDTRIHCIRSDGSVMLGVFDNNENVLCWSNLTTAGAVEDVAILPGQNGATEDQVYYIVNRTINGSTVRFLEKWALETECRGGTLNKQADAFTIYSGAATNTITGLSYLEGQSVVVWADGVDLSPTVSGVQKTYTVTGGQITLGTTVTHAVIGLAYTGQWQSTKLGEAMQMAPALSAKKNMAGLGLLCAYFHPKGLQYGNTLDALYDMPEVEQGQVINANTIRDSYDEAPFFLDGGWTTDLRLCLQAQAPRPVTVMAAVCDSEVSL